MHGPKTDLKLIQTTTKKKLLCSKNLCWTKIEEKCKKIVQKWCKLFLETKVVQEAVDWITEMKVKKI